jgi:hypothetical protein
VDIGLVANDAVFRTHMDALVTVDTAGWLDDVSTVAGGEIADGVGWTGAPAEAAVDARIEEDAYGHG